MKTDYLGETQEQSIVLSSKGRLLMDVQSVTCVCFSPTGSTKTLAENIARGISGEAATMIDLTLRSQRSEHSLTFHKEIVILATPVYYGRVPEEAVSCFSSLAGEQTQQT